MVLDNGPQFSSEEFATFSKSWGFTHVTSSPHYPQSNGKAENAVKTLKRLLKKYHELGQSEYLALLYWRKTPLEGLGTSSAQRFLGRRCKTLLPTTKSRLQPSFPTAADVQARTQQRRRQQLYYDKHTKALKPVAAGETVRIRLPGSTTWCMGTCKRLVAPRSYEVQVGERICRCNRRQLIEANEPPKADPPVVDLQSSDQSLSATDLPKGTQRQDIEQTASQQEQKAPPHPSNAPAIEFQPRRSGRITKPLK